MKKNIAIFFSLALAVNFVSCSKSEDEKELPPTPETVDWFAVPKSEIYDIISDPKTLVALEIKTVTAQEMQNILDTKYVSKINDEKTLCVYREGDNATVATTAKKIIIQDNGRAIFGSLRSMKSLKGLEIMDFSNSKDLCTLFYGCEQIEYLDISSLNTSSAEDVSSMFEFCYKLQTLKVGSSFILDNVKLSGKPGNLDGFHYMFWIDIDERPDMNIVGCPDSQKETIKRVWLESARAKEALSFDGQPAFNN